MALITFRVAYEQWIADPGGDPSDRRLLGVLAAIGRDISRADPQLR